MFQTDREGKAAELVNLDFIYDCLSAVDGQILQEVYWSVDSLEVTCCGLNFCLELRKCKNFQDQIKVIQSHKKSLRAYVILEASNAIQSTNWIKTIQVMLILYLSPKFKIFRCFIEWVPELISNAIRNSSASSAYQSIVVSVRAVCLIIIDSFQFQQLSYYQRNSMKDILSSLNSMALLFKEGVPWLLMNDVGGDDDMLHFFVTLLSNILHASISNVFLNSEQSSFEGNCSVTGIEVTCQIECCSDCMRVMVTVLTAWSCQIASYDTKQGSSSDKAYLQAPRWVNLMNAVMKDMSRALLSGLVSKDAGTNLALGVVTLQQFLLTTAYKGYYQLLAMLGLMDINAHYSNGVGKADRKAEVNHANLVRFALMAEIHPEILSMLPNIKVELKIAIIRACLALLDRLAFVDAFAQSNEKFSVQLSAASLQVQASLGLSEFFSSITLWRGSLLLGPMRSNLIIVCGDPSPGVQLYALQTLEVWLCRVAECHAGSIEDLESVRDILQELENLAAMLTVCWGHPSRQVVEVPQR